MFLGAGVFNGKKTKISSALAVYSLSILLVVAIIASPAARAMSPRCLLITQAAAEVSPRIAKLLEREGAWERLLREDGVFKMVGSAIASAEPGKKEWRLRDGELHVQFTTEIRGDKIEIQFTYLRAQGAAIGARPEGKALLFARALVGTLDGVARRAEKQPGQPLEVTISTGPVLNDVARDTLEGLGMNGRWAPQAIAGATFLWATRQISFTQLRERWPELMAARRYDITFNVAAPARP